MKREYSLNKVEGFNPYDYLVGETAEDGRVIKSLPTSAKTFWFKMVYPKGRIMLIPFRPEKSFEGTKIYGFEVRIFKDTGETLLANWHETLTIKEKQHCDNQINALSEKALDRALTIAGFGCEIEANLSFPSYEIT